MKHLLSYSTTAGFSQGSLGAVCQKFIKSPKNCVCWTCLFKCLLTFSKFLSCDNTKNLQVDTNCIQKFILKLLIRFLISFLDIFIDLSTFHSIPEKKNISLKFLCLFAAYQHISYPRRVIFCCKHICHNSCHFLTTCT